MNTMNTTKQSISYDEWVDREWKALLSITPAVYGDNIADEIASIMVDQDYELRQHRKVMLIEALTMEDKWDTIVQNTPPVYGNPDSDEIAKILIIYTQEEQNRTGKEEEYGDEYFLHEESNHLKMQMILKHDNVVM